METYFEKYSEEMNAAEVESPVSEENFMRFYKHKVRGRRIRITVSTLAAVAVALVAVVLFVTSRQANNADFVTEYINEYRSALRPLYDDVVSMESQSEICAELGLSSIMKDLVESVTEFNSDLEGLDGETRMEMVRQYCMGQTECIAQLYAECVSSREMYY